MNSKILKKESVVMIVVGTLALLSIGSATAASNDVQQPVAGQQQPPMMMGQGQQQPPMPSQQGRPPIMGSSEDNNIPHPVNAESHYIPHSFFAKMNNYNQELAHLHFKQMKLMREGKTEEAQALNSKIRSVQEELMTYQREH